MHNFKKIPLRCLMVAGVFTLSISSWANTINAKASNKSGEDMPDVVVYATPLDGKLPPPAHAVIATVAQDQLQFSPYVTPVQVGSEIRFPNHDKVEHHVKSFSAAKEFEIKPYEKVTPAPVLFDKTGVVVIYCLIHEWMRSYVYVIDTPYFATTDATGHASLDNLPPGNYEIRAWHPDMGMIKSPLMQTVKVGTDGGRQIKFDFDFMPKKRKSAKIIP